MNVSIQKIEVVSFGKLKNIVVNPQKGINILCAPNESGKSTLASFIKFVFYGFAGTRTKSLTENERKLYTPWDGEVSEGSIHIIADGVRYIVHRRCLPSGKEVCEITNRATGKTEFAGSVAGEVFFGVGEGVFARTLFFKQLTLPQSEDGVVAERLRNIAISADEEVGTQKALKRLNDCKNEIKGKMGNGLLPGAERERDAVSESLALSESMRKESQILRENIKSRNDKIEDIQKKLSELNSEKENIDKYNAFLRLKGLKKLSDEEKNAAKDFADVSSKLKQYPESSVFQVLTSKNGEVIAQRRNCESISEKLNSAKEQMQELQEKSSKISILEDLNKQFTNHQKKTKMFFAFSVLGLALGLGVLLVNTIAGLSISALGAVFAIAGILFLFKGKNLLKDNGFDNFNYLNDEFEKTKVFAIRIEESQKNVLTLQENLAKSKLILSRLETELNLEIGKYCDSDNKDEAEGIRYILQVSSEISEKKAVWQAKKSALESALNGIDPEALALQARGARVPERENATVERELRFYQNQFQQLSELNRQNELECTALEAKSGDPAVLKGKLDMLNGRIAELTLKYKAYETAMKLINDSADQMKSMVMPMLGKKADEYFSIATDGKYNSLELDTKLSMTFGDDFRRSCDYLSAGTRDSAYLSLRLALADVLFGGCGVPMILDDAFVRMDDNRLAQMSKALMKASQKHQIFIFTHSNREANALSGVGGEYTNIEIKQI